jgi:hypothetical protein
MLQSVTVHFNWIIEMWHFQCSFWTIVLEYDRRFSKVSKELEPAVLQDCFLPRRCREQISPKRLLVYVTSLHAVTSSHRTVRHNPRRLLTSAFALTEIGRKLDNNAYGKTGSISISAFTPQHYHIFPVHTDASRRVVYTKTFMASAGHVVLDSACKQRRMHCCLRQQILSIAVSEAEVWDKTVCTWYMHRVSCCCCTLWAASCVNVPATENIVC